MRIALAHWTRRVAGGAEEFLARVAAGFRAAGHDLGLWYETDEPGANRLLDLGVQVPSWGAQSLGARESLQELRAWNPDVIYCNGVVDPSWHSEFRKIAPSVLSIHAYSGTCISGTKAHFGDRPCERRFGPACVGLYLPLRCGGLSPVTMLRDYEKQRRLLDEIRRYDGVVVHSNHMHDEYSRHGVRTSRVYLPLAPASGRAVERPTTILPSRLLYLGRMTRIKGGRLLFRALAIARKRLTFDLHVTLAGDGNERAAWAAAASRIRAGVHCDFVGWVDGEERARLMSQTDLLLFPSTWPEPFGMVGLEAAEHGVPAAAFDVGGVSEWLHDGRNGALAPGERPTAEGLAAAIVRCVGDAKVHARLREGARQVYDRFAASDPVEELIAVFKDAASR